MNLHDKDREGSVSLIKAALAPEHGVAERHVLQKGDLPGHPFRGNQYKDGDAAPDTPRIGGPTGRLDARALGQQGKFPFNPQFPLPAVGDDVDYYDDKGDKRSGRVKSVSGGKIKFANHAARTNKTIPMYTEQTIVHAYTGKKVG